MLLLVLMFYMCGQYYQFLLQTTYSTQEALLDTVNENLATPLDGYVAKATGNFCALRSRTMAAG